MAVTLPSPSRNEAGPGRQRGLRQPTVEDVPNVAGTRDPGLVVPRGGMDLGLALTEVAKTIGDRAERQQKLKDATESGEAEIGFGREAMAEFNRRQTEDDPSRDDFMADYDKWLGERQEAILGERGEKLSSEARARLTLRLSESRAALVDSAGRLQLQSQQKKAGDVIDQKINVWSAQAARDPAFLDIVLGVADEELADFSNALTPDQERTARSKARASIIASSVGGLVDQKKFDEAETLLKSGRFDEDLAPGARDKAMSAIETGRKAAQAQMRADVQLELQDEIAAIRETGQGIGLSNSRIVAAYGDRADRIIKTLAEERTFYQAKSTVALNSPEEDAALVARLTPQGEGFAVEVERRDAVVKAIEAKRKAIAQDPAAYAMMASSDVQKAFADVGQDPAKLRRAIAMSDATQDRLGVPEHQRRALPNSQAKAVVQKVTAVDPERAADLLQGVAAEYGDSWPAVYRDLVRADLPPTYRVLAETDDPIARKELATALKVEQTEKGALRRALPSTDAGAIDEDVNSALQDFRATLAYAPDGAVAADSYQSAARLLAYRYAANGMSSGQAAKRAVADLVNKKYAFVQDGNFNARVPPQFETVAIETARRTLAGLTAAEMPDPGGAPDLSPARRQEIMLGAAKRGTWITNETDDGWLLLDVNQQPVNRADGSRVEFKFTDAAPTTADMPEAWRPEGNGMERNSITGELRRKVAR